MNLRSNSTVILCCGLLLAIRSVNASDNVEYWLDAYLSFGYSDIADESMQQIVRLTPGLRASLSQRTRIVLEGRIRVDFADKLEPGRADTSTYSSLSRPAVINDLGTADIRDAYIERTLSNGVLRLGKQQIVWGKLDGIKVLDVLNPQDLREFILEDFGESRISLWSAYLDVTLAGWRTELAIIPDNTGHAIPVAGAWFELTAPRYRYGASPDAPAPPVTTHRDSIRANTSAYALKISRQLGSMEIGAMAYSGLDHEPLGRFVVRDSETVIERYYERRDVYGVSAETALGAVALRAEVSWQPDRVFNTRTPTTLSSEPLDQVTAGIGVDMDGPWDTFINIQYLHDNVRRAPDSLVRPSSDRIATFFLRRSFSYDTVRLTAKYYRALDLGDAMYSLALGVAIGDSTKVKLAAEGFDGPASGIFGQFHDRDRVTLGLTHTF